MKALWKRLGRKAERRGETGEGETDGVRRTNRVYRCWVILQIKLHIKQKEINLFDSLFHEFLTSLSV